MTTIRPDLLEHLEQVATIRGIDPNHLIEQWIIEQDILTDITLDAVITISADHIITAYNLAAEDIFGYTKQEAIGQPLNLLLPSEFHDVHRHHIQEFAQSDDNKRRMNKRDTIIGRRKDGSEFYAEASIGKTNTNDGMRFYVTLRDITERVTIRQQLENSEQRLHLMMDHISDLVCLHDADGTYRFVSAASYRLTGYQPEELIGNNPYDFFHPDDIIRIKTSHSTARDGRDTTSTIYRFRHKDGHYRWFETNTHPIKDDDETTIQLVTATRDITSHIETQQELSRERDLLEKIMDTSPSGISVVDKSGQLEFANKRSEQILRLRKSEQLERSYDSAEWKHTHYDGTPWPDEKQPFVRVMKTKKPVYNVQHAIESPDGTRVLLSINGAPIFDDEGEVEKVVFTIEDVTEIKRAEQSLRETLKTEREVTTLKSRFLSIVSHEFRTPLSVIMTSTDMLELSTKNLLDKRSLGRLDQIRRQIRYLDAQLNEISSFNKSNQSEIKLNLEQTYLVDLIQELIDEITHQYPDSPPIQVHTPHKRSDSFLLDSQLLQHIFSNLISNAVKYSNGNGEINIIVDCNEKAMHFSIKDQGIGISEADKENLFNFFYRGDNVGNIKGTGIGLAVVKQSVTAHGGTIEFESELGVGTQFAVNIPITETKSISSS